MYPISKQITSIGFSRDLLVTNPVTNEKKSQIQGNLHQWFRMHNPTGIIHIPKTQKFSCLVIKLVLDNVMGLT